MLTAELEKILKVEFSVRRIRHSSTMIPTDYFNQFKCLEDLLDFRQNILNKSEAFSVRIF